jgi:hypothetical protein
MLPLPLTANFTAYAGLPNWEVQQPVLLVALCTLAALLAPHCASGAPAPTAPARRGGGEAACPGVGGDLERVFVVANMVPLVASVLAALWRMESDNCGVVVGESPSCGPVEIALDALGLMTARCARLDLALCLLPAAKESLWLLVLPRATPHDYSSAMPLHQVAGYACAMTSGLHSLAYLLFYALAQPGGWHGLWINCFPVPVASRLNSLGLVNWMGVLATTVGCALVLLALKQRKTHYHLFQRFHLPLALLFAGCCALHDLPILFFSLPGLVSWYLCSSRSAATRQLKATARLLQGAGEWVELTIATEGRLVGRSAAGGFPTAQGGGPGQWVSLRVPAALGPEWHPFSVAGLGSEAVSVVVSGQGDWSRKLRQLAPLDPSKTAEPFDVDLEGPFCNGGGWSLLDGGGGFERSGHRLLLVAGGTGITGWLPGLQARSASTGAGLPPYRLVWCVRTESDYQALGERIPLATGEDEVVVCFTRRDGASASTTPLDNGWRSPNLQRQGSTPMSFTAPPAGIDPEYVVLLVSVFSGLAVGYWGWTLHRPDMHIGDDIGWVGLVRYTVARRCMPILAILLVSVTTAALARRAARHGLPLRQRLRTVCQDPEKEDGCAGAQPAAASHQVRHGRPDLEDLVAESAAAVSGGGLLTVVACGPNGLVRAARSAAKAVASRPAHEHPAIRFVGAEADW